MFEIHIIDRQSLLPPNTRRMRRALEKILQDAEVRRGAVTVAVVGDAEMHELNRRYLDHDYPTDSLSFVMENSGDRLEGEVIVSAETAARVAPQYGWAAEDELLLYAVHATLHLVGYDDTSLQLAAAMRAAERRYLAEVGVTGPRCAEAASRAESAP